MKLVRDVVRAISLAAAAGVAVGGGFGLLAPASAEAGSTTPVPAAARAHAIVTSVDLLGSERLEVTVRFTNTGRTAEHVDTFDVLADGQPLAHQGPATAAFDLRPGMSAEETVAFAAPPVTASLVLTLSNGERLGLQL
ncbi:hypothetical protein ACQP00_12415 [Dactylosporangium sp. CS-047395]|uniref:hypothetical protein n=1 Tax=Dactylosporangium sp. CS-047395 TaxID=3239936 RepID=UPI003D9052DE